MGRSKIKIKKLKLISFAVNFKFRLHPRDYDDVGIVIKDVMTYIQYNIIYYIIIIFDMVNNKIIITINI